MSTAGNHTTQYTTGQEEKTNAKLTVTSWTNKQLKKKTRSINTMRLFGIPYQFIETVDPRIDGINTSIGYNYLTDITLSAPIAYIIPGKPIFLPSKMKSKKSSTAMALLDGAEKGSFSQIQRVLSGNPSQKLRYYDFQEDYMLYMSYVNAMCRTVAGFLGLTQKIPTANGKPLQSYDWKNYRFDMTSWHTGASKGASSLVQTTTSKIKNKITRVVHKLTGKSSGKVRLSTSNSGENNTSRAFRNNSYVAFYIDPSSNISESISNSTTQSQIKSALDTASSQMKELQFLTNSAGIDSSGVQQFTDNAFSALDTMMNNFGALGNVISRIATAGSAVVKGENISMPDIYDRSSMSRDYTLDIHLKAPYGNKFAIYMDVIVPMLHLLALVLPRQSTANTYGAPFLVKIFYPGVYNCNLGIVTSISFNKSVSPESFTTEGLPNEVDCSLQIQDLYSDLAMSPSTDPTLFVNNGSMIDYLSTISGLSLIDPQLKKKAQLYVNAYKNAIIDIPSNAMANISSSFDRKLQAFVSLH